MKAPTRLPGTNVIDIIYLKKTGTASYKLSAHTGENVVSAGRVSNISTPSGYTELFSWATVSGDPNVLSVGVGSLWVVNTRDTTSGSVTAILHKVFVKYA